MNKLPQKRKSCQKQSDCKQQAENMFIVVHSLEKTVLQLLTAKEEGPILLLAKYSMRYDAMLDKEFHELFTSKIQVSEFD